MRRAMGVVCSLSLVLMLSAGLASAQTQGPLPAFDLERLRLNPSTEGSLTVGTGELLPAGTWKVSLAGHYEHRPLLVSRAGAAVDVVASRVTAELMGAYAFFDWLEVDLAAPIVLYQDGTELRAQGLSHFGGAGMVSLMPRFGVLSRRRAPLDLALGMELGLPLGGMSGLTRDVSPVYAPSLMAGYSFGGVRVATEAILRVRPSVVISPSASQVRDEIGSEIEWGGAAMQVGRRLRWEVDAWARVPLVRQPASGELLAGGRYFLTSSIELFGLLGVGLGSAPGTPTFRLVVGGSYGTVVPARAPREPLASCDGLAHSLQDCPEFDDDGDGVRNDVDQCPLEPGRTDFYGCAKLPDRDGDGVLDRDDACPDVPGLIAKRGCPLEDRDSDGMEDKDDECPDQRGLPQFKGCPDSDSDGIPDNLDACPNQKGKAELQGCMPPDLDEDGVPNSLDSCINEPGPADEAHAGCRIPPLVTIGLEETSAGGAATSSGPRRKALVLRQKVYFKTGVPDLDPRSFELLDSVGKILVEHPEIKTVEVGAHTDARGSDQEQHRLTDLRADAVCRYLISKGVDAKRLSAKGYGHDKWVASDATAQGREANRRVEFIVTSEEQVTREGAAP